MSLNPNHAADSIKEYYLRYLATYFPLADEELKRSFENALAGGDWLINGPLVEATPPFQKGRSVSSLIEEGLLSARFTDLDDPEEFPLGRPLFSHQEKALRKVIQYGRNIVIATGTGSGKTEAFLIPILNHLYEELESGSLGPGVRALLLYPMNALANDQMKRLRKLLVHAPEITFGRYIGETPRSINEAEEYFKRMFPGDDILPNELISREEMQGNPPHVLLTNYAMLEYLLLRPKDHVFFDRDLYDTWRFIVLDEAHVYDGAKGTEIGLLLRRLRERVNGSEKGRLCCIATSATLGKGKADYPRLAEFATQIFDENFEWEDNDEKRQDIVFSNPLPPREPDPEYPDVSARFFKDLDAALQDSPDRLPPLLAQAGFPANIEKEIENIIASTGDDPAKRNSRLLFAILRDNPQVLKLQRALLDKPLSLNEAAREIFPDLDHDQGAEAFITLVDLAARAVGEERLLPARYHLFARAVEGVFIQFKPQKRVYLRRQAEVDGRGKKYPVFEAATCTNCGALFLIGRKVFEGELHYLREAPLYEPQDNGGNEDFYFLAEEAALSRLDEDEVVAGGGVGTEELPACVLCTLCGALSPEGGMITGCSCDSDIDAALRVIKVGKGARSRKYCPSCSAPASSVNRFLIGKDAACGVLATALYQNLPPGEGGISTAANVYGDDEWLPSSEVSLKRKDMDDKIQGGRKLLVFSDSRQDAAFFACYLDESYNRFLRRRLIVQALDKYRESLIHDRWDIADLAREVKVIAEKAGIFPVETSPRSREIEALKWTMQELLRIERRNCLEELGLIFFELDMPQSYRTPRPLLERWHLSEGEANVLISILVDTVRSNGAIDFPEGVSPSDATFAPRNRPTYFRKLRSEIRKGVYSWLPSEKRFSNKRSDFLHRLSELCVGEKDTELCEETLDGIWRILTDANSSPFRAGGKVVPKAVSGIGDVFQFSYFAWSPRPGKGMSGETWYRCTGCGRVTHLNLKNLCPVTFGCNGRLEPFEPWKELDDNHYFRLYHDLDPLPMKVEEHTAQLTSRAAGELQQYFLEGKVQVLSCSTTFELGVDVGELEAVFLRNVPPQASNYLQRAGRAGRRTSSAAFALTYAQRRSHDFHYFRYPLQMIQGKISPPSFYVENEKIARRHLHATILSMFFKEYPKRFADVEAFFLDPVDSSGPEEVRDFIRAREAVMLPVLKRVVPETFMKISA